MSFVPKYIIILFGLITIDFFLAKEINKREGYHRKLLLLISIVANLGTLIFFRYFNFLNENITALAHVIHWNYSPLLLSIALPLGLSFHVFQSLSYVIEVYKKRVVPERNYLTYALYVMFFPQLVAGPIERPQHLLPQLNTIHAFDALQARKGLERILWGLFKKLVIADQIAQIINPLYANLPKEGLLLIVIAILFAYQLYCDFSGYSDIAIGVAMMFGYSLTENFNRPYASRSVGEFWRRWHISLSNWLRDYLYYPLALSWGKGSKIKLYTSLLITFILIGLWHGANWTFAIFGAMHGVYLIIESVTEKTRRKLYKILHLENIQAIHHFIQSLIVFVLVSISFIFFRAETVSKAWWFITNMFSSFSFNFTIHDLLQSLTLHMGNIVLYVVIVSVCIMEGFQYFQEKKNTFYIFDLMPKVVRYGWYYGLTTLILVFGYFGSQTFIYFQF
jgi:alginate O-acetyltransferase complex protein AlgI